MVTKSVCGECRTFDDPTTSCFVALLYVSDPRTVFSRETAEKSAWHVELQIDFRVGLFFLPADRSVTIANNDSC